MRIGKLVFDSTTEDQQEEMVTAIEDAGYRVEQSVTTAYIFEKEESDEEQEEESDEDSKDLEPKEPRDDATGEETEDDENESQE